MAKNAFEFSLDVFDESVISQSIFAIEYSIAVVAIELLFSQVAVVDVLLHLIHADQFAAYFARALFYIRVVTVFLIPSWNVFVGGRFGLFRRFDDSFEAILFARDPSLVHVGVSFHIGLRHESGTPMGR